MKTLFAPLLALAFPAAAQQVPAPLVLAGDPGARVAWVQRFATPGDDWINDIVPVGGGRFLAVGFLDRGDGRDWRALAGLLNADGGLFWRGEYGAGGAIDALWSAEPGADGGFALAGFTTRIGAGGINGYALFADAEGSIRKEYAFGGDGYDRFTDLAPAGDGFVFLGHSQLPGEERRRLFLVHTDSRGVVRWERIIEGPESLAALYVEPAGDGGFVVAGGIGRGQGEAADSDLLVLKFDAGGREVWRRTIGTPQADDVNHGLAVRADGSIVVVGYSKSWSSRDNDILAATLSPAGEVLRRELLGGAGDDRPILAKVDAEGQVWIVGYTKSAGAGGWDVIVARLGAGGGFDSGVLTLGGSGDDNGTAIRPLGDGSLLVAGYSTGLGGGGEDAFVARIDGTAMRMPHPAFTRREVR